MNAIQNRIMCKPGAFSLAFLGWVLEPLCLEPPHDLAFPVALEDDVASSGDGRLEVVGLG